MDFLRKIFSFNGRSGRLEYIGVHLLILLLILIPYFVLLGGTASSSSFTGLMNSIGSSIMLYLILFLPIIWIDFAVMFRRLHDINQPGWVYFIVFFITFIPIIGLIVYFLFFLLLLVWPGSKNKNRFDLIKCSNCGTINSQVSEKCLSCNSNLKENNDKKQELENVESKEINKSISFDKIIEELDVILFKDDEIEKIIEGLKYINNLDYIDFNLQQAREITLRISKLFNNLDSISPEKKELFKNKIEKLIIFSKNISINKVSTLDEYKLKIISIEAKLNELAEINDIENKIDKLKIYEISKYKNLLYRYKKEIEKVKVDITSEIKLLEEFFNETNFLNTLEETNKIIQNIKNENLKDIFNIVYLSNKILDNKELHISIKVHLKEILTNLNILFTFDYDNLRKANKSFEETIKEFESMKNKLFILENTNIDSLSTILKLLETKLSKHYKKRSLILYTTILIIIVGVSAKYGADYYEDYKWEQYHLANEKLRIEQQKIQEERNRIAKEKEMAKQNINRVENTIFIDNLLISLKSSVKKEIEEKFTEIDKEEEYKLNIEKFISEQKMSIQNEITKTCTNEAGKETSAISKCIENNTEKLANFTNSLLDQSPKDISNKIYNKKIESRNERIDKILSSLEKQLNNKKLQIKALQSKYDDYYIDNKQIPSTLKTNISETTYDIENLEYKINYYRDIRNTNKYNFSEPKDLVKKLKGE